VVWAAATLATASPTRTPTPSAARGCGRWKKGLGSAFTPDVKADWTTVYTVLATTMKAGAETRA
jgi:hypothetical protein